MPFPSDMLLSDFCIINILKGYDPAKPISKMRRTINDDFDDHDYDLKKIGPRDIYYVKNKAGGFDRNKTASRRSRDMWRSVPFKTIQENSP